MNSRVQYIFRKVTKLNIYSLDSRGTRLVFIENDIREKSFNINIKTLEKAVKGFYEYYKNFIIFKTGNRRGKRLKLN